MATLFGIAQIDNSIWYVDAQTGLLINLEIPQMKVVEKVYIQNINEKYAYSAGVVYGDKIIFAPNRMRNIMIYDRILKKTHFVEIYNTSKRDTLIREVVMIGKKAYFIPFDYDEMIILDLDSFEIYYEDGITKTIFGNDYQTGLKFWSATVYENKIFLPTLERNVVGIYNIDSNNIVTFKVGDENTKLKKVLVSENRLYVLPVNEKYIYIYDVDDYHFIDKVVIIEEEKGYKQYLADIIDCGDYFLLPQRFHDKSYLLYKNNLAVQEFDLFVNVVLDNKCIMFAKRVSDRNVILVLRDNESYMGVYDIYNKSTEWKKTPTHRSNCLYIEYGNRRIINEANNMKLIDYIELIL